MAIINLLTAGTCPERLQLNALVVSCIYHLVLQSIKNHSSIIADG